MTHIPIILIDLFTEEGVVGRSYLKPYLPKAMKYLIPALLDFGEMLKGRRVSPVDLYETARKSLHFVGYQGLSMIAVAGLDMAAWDALAKAAEVGELLDERGGGFRAVKLRLGRADARDDLATIKAVRDAIGDDIDLMVDFNQALNLADALRRGHMIDDHGFVWIEEPVLYDDFDSSARLTAELKTPIQIGENFYGPRDVHVALQKKACDLIMPDLMRIGGVTGFLRSAAIAGAAGIPISTHFYPEVGAHVMRVAESPHFLEWLDWSYPVLQRHFEIRDGQVHVPEAPGVGIEWDEKVVAASQVGLV